MSIRVNGRLIAVLCAIAAVAVMIIAGVWMTSSKTTAKSALDITNRICVPILTYHSIQLQKDGLGDFSILPSELESDLIYIRENGYTTIHLKDLTEYCYKGTPLPKQPIILTFDGGFESCYKIAFPLLEKYETKAVFSVVGADIDKASEQPAGSTAFMRWKELREVTESDLVEVVNQSYSLNSYKDGTRKGIAKLRKESLADYKAVLSNDIGRMQEEARDKTGILPVAFSYPYGIICRESVDLISEMGFAATLSSEPGVNYLSGSPDELFGLRRNNRPHGMESEEVFDKMYRVKVAFNSIKPVITYDVQYDN
jgi:peptidoglycan/xylan/chitin deacetylase (PgdA/CDA1 family)